VLFLTLAYKCNYHSATTQFAIPKLMTMASVGAIRGNTCPILASSGISGSPRPVVLGDALGTVPPDLHGHRNGSRSRSILFCHRFDVLHNRS